VEPSILKSTKTQLDIASDDSSFDNQVMGYLNGVLPDLLDFGLGPSEGFFIEDDSATWEDLLGDGAIGQLGRVKNWVWLKVRLLWDPPQTSFHLDSHEKLINEAAWRIINKLDGDRYVPPELTEGDQLILDGGGP
jgi:hypothetical protein